ncbi:IS110 family transposase [soil metagenome]
MVLDHIDALTAQIAKLTERIDELLAQIPAAQAPPPNVDSPGRHDDNAPLNAVARLDEIPGIGVQAAQAIIAEIGLDMSQFPTAGHLVSWAKLSPRTIQSGAKNRSATTGKGNPYLKGVLGEAAAAAARTDTFLGERYRRLVKRRGKLKALVAVARSILVIVWHLLADPTARFHDLGADHYTTTINKQRKTRPLVHQLQALGHHVPLTAAA